MLNQSEINLQKNRIMLNQSEIDKKIGITKKCIFLIVLL